MTKFKESALAHSMLDNLAGIEIGASAHNPFGLRTKNVGLKIDGYILEQETFGNEAVTIDIEAPAHAIPLPDESEDFIISSHVLEHCPDVIRTLLEWYRIVKVDGYIYMIVPHRDASSYDYGREISSLEHFIDDYLNDVANTSESNSKIYADIHCHVFTPESLKKTIAKLFNHHLYLVAEQKYDDKVGNGFTLVYQKKTSNSNFSLNSLCKIKTKQSVVKITFIIISCGDTELLNLLIDNINNQTICSTYDTEHILITNTKQDANLFLDIITSKNNTVILYSNNISRAIEKACFIAKGQYSTLIFASDSYHKNHFESLIRELDKNINRDLAYTNLLCTTKRSQSFNNHVRSGYINFDNCEIFLDILNANPVPHIRYIWRSSICNEINFKFIETDLWNLFVFKTIFTARRSSHIRNYTALIYESYISKFDHITNSISKERSILAYEHDEIVTINTHYEHKRHSDKYVNISIITYNRLEFTKQSINSILLHTNYPHIISIIDNNSTDGTKEYLQNLKDIGIIKNLILLNENIGVAKASNLAWSLEPDAEYYLKFDNDIVINKDNWLYNMVECAEIDDIIGAVAYNFEPKSYPLCTINGYTCRIKHNGTLGGACILIPKRTFNKIGYWCEDYGLYGEEDYDYGMRILLSGLYNVYMEDEHIGIHLPGGKAASIDPNTFVAKDGLEESLHKEYREWKDHTRMVNIRTGLVQTNIQMYTNDRKSVYRNSDFINFYLKKTNKNPFFSKKINITVFSFDSKETACAQLRLISPISKLENQVNLIWATDYIDNENQDILASIMHSDLIIIQRFFPNKNTEALIEILAKTKIPIIYETDDLLLDIPKYNQHQKISSQIRAFLLKTISFATAITVSTPKLKEYYSKYHSNIHVLPNLLDAKIWLPSSKKKLKDTITIGYAGTTDHIHDLVMLDKILPIIVNRFGTSVNFHFLGCKTELLSKLPNFKFTPLQPNYASYATTLINSDIDIGLAPLHDNQFNCCKSNIKWLEYSICGISGIYSDLAPYTPYVEHRKTGLLVKNNDIDSWIESIILLIENFNLRKSISAQAKAKVLSNYLCDKEYNSYYEAWVNTSILKQKL